MTSQTIHFPELKEAAKNAFAWTSFYPEVRGEQVREEYGNLLQADIAELQSYGISADIIDNYKAKFKCLFVNWLLARGRCASTMITGGSNFNVRRNEKANRSEQRQATVFTEWREKAKRSIIRKAQPPKTFQSELDRLQDELKEAIAQHELNKQGNRKIKSIKSKEELSEYLKTVHKVSSHMIDFTIAVGFTTANSLSRIKRLEERIKVLESKEKLAQNVGEKNISFEGGVVILNYEIDRIQIQHDRKPDKDVISTLKKNGFKWSPSNTCWQRQITPNAINATKQITGITIK